MGRVYHTKQNNALGSSFNALAETLVTIKRSYSVLSTVYAAIMLFCLFFLFFFLYFVFVFMFYLLVRFLYRSHFPFLTMFSLY
jgi:hypothetical protein